MDIKKNWPLFACMAFVASSVFAEDAPLTTRAAYLAFRDCVHQFAATRAEVDATVTEIGIAAVSQCDNDLNALRRIYIERTKADFAENEDLDRLSEGEINERIARGADQLCTEAAEKAKASAIRIAIDTRWMAKEDRKKAHTAPRP